MKPKKNINLADYPILLVDDDDLDVECFTRALKKIKAPNPFYRASDGVEALEFLKGQNGKEKIDYPRVIFLDINMPRMNGFEFLERIKNDEDMSQNIIFMLTTSDRSNDIAIANAYNISGYLIKGNVLQLADFFENFLKPGAAMPVPH